MHSDTLQRLDLFLRPDFKISLKTVSPDGLGFGPPPPHHSLSFFLSFPPSCFICLGMKKNKKKNKKKEMKKETKIASCVLYS